MRLFQGNYYSREIFAIDREIASISREIRRLEKSLRKMKKAAEPPLVSPRKKLLKKQAPESETRRRLVSYLSAGTIQTIRQEKFRSDIVRRRRYLMAALILILAGVVFLLWKFAL